MCRACASAWSSTAARSDAMIYLDNAATTRPDPAVLEAMARAKEDYGNASSLHRLGVAAAKAVEKARAEVAEALQARPEEVVFTSGGTEANNLALKGVLLACGRRGGLVVSAIEHPSVLEPARALGRCGWRLRLAAADPDGLVDPAAVAAAMDSRTVLVSVMHANNEVGTLQPLAEIGRLCRKRGVLFHTDASQSFTKEPLEPRRLGADLVTLSGHKIHGPKGVGALYVRAGLKLEPLLHGGGQEAGRRAGTVNTPGVAGFARAVELSGLDAWRVVAARRDHLQRRLAAAFPDAIFNGVAAERVGGILSVTLAGVGAREVLQDLSARGICASAGSACSSGDNAPSAVLLALGLSPEAARSTLRLSLGRTTTDEEVELLVAALVEIVGRRRGGSA